MGAVRRFWAPCVLSLSLGCSFSYVHGPPPEHAGLSYFDCVSSTAAPMADIAGVAWNGLIALGTSLDDSKDSNHVSPAVPITFGTLAALHAASAIYGFIVTNHCDEAKQRLAARIAAREARLELLEQQFGPQPVFSKPIGASCRADEECQAGVCARGVCVAPHAISGPLPALKGPAANAPGVPANGSPAPAAPGPNAAPASPPAPAPDSAPAPGAGQPAPGQGAQTAPNTPPAPR